MNIRGTILLGVTKSASASVRLGQVTSLALQTLADHPNRPYAQDFRPRCHPTNWHPPLLASPLSQGGHQPEQARDQRLSGAPAAWTISGRSSETGPLCARAARGQPWLHLCRHRHQELLQWAEQGCSSRRSRINRITLSFDYICHGPGLECIRYNGRALASSFDSHNWSWQYPFMFILIEGASKKRMDPQEQTTISVYVFIFRKVHSNTSLCIVWLCTSCSLPYVSSCKYSNKCVKSEFKPLYKGGEPVQCPGILLS